MSGARRVALLDVDGTLVDSNDAHANAWVEALAAHGHEVPFARVRELIGKGGDKLLPETTGIAKDSVEGQEISKRRSAIFAKTYLPSLRAFPGARDLLQELKARGVKLVVATSAQRGELDKLLEAADVADLIEEAATSSDAEDSKPDPDIVLAALRAAGCKPHEAVMLGDTPYDVAAATKAGVRVIALRCGGWDDAGLAGATAIYDHARDLLKHLDTSPFADGPAR